MVNWESSLLCPSKSKTQFPFFPPQAPERNINVNLTFEYITGQRKTDTGHLGAQSRAIGLETPVSFHYHKNSTIKYETIHTQNNFNLGF